MYPNVGVFTHFMLPDLHRFLLSFEKGPFYISLQPLQKLEMQVSPCEGVWVFSYSVRSWWHPLFPLDWIDESVVILWYDCKYLTLEKARIICLSRKFYVIDSCTIIVLWHKGDDYLGVYLGKFWITYFFSRYFPIAHVTIVCCFAYQMARIYAEENRKTWEKIQIARGETNSP